MNDLLAILIGGVIQQVTGPTAGYVVAPLEARRQALIERTTTRLQRTREAADHASRGQPLDPSDRVAQKALTEAAFNDDALVADYLGGVIAASASNDDAGAPIVGQIARLSAAQLRLHYVIYRELHRLAPSLNGKVPNLYQESSCPTIVFDTAGLIAALGQLAIQLVTDAPVLIREGLLHDRWSLKSEDVEGKGQRSVFRIKVSGNGTELFLWGHGVRNVPGRANSLLTLSDDDLSLLSEVPEVTGARLATANESRSA